MSRPAWRSVLAYTLLLAAAIAIVVALCHCDPAPAPADIPTPAALPSARQVVIWHREPDGSIRWGRLATCRGNVCLPGPTVTP